MTKSVWPQRFRGQSFQHLPEQQRAPFLPPFSFISSASFLLSHPSSPLAAFSPSSSCFCPFNLPVTSLCSLLSATAYLQSADWGLSNIQQGWFKCCWGSNDWDLWKILISFHFSLLLLSLHISMLPSSLPVTPALLITFLSDCLFHIIKGSGQL